MSKRLDPLNPQSAAFLFLLAGIGLCFTVIGLVAQPSQPFWSILFTSLGGTVFGTAVGLWFTRIFEPSQIGSLLTVLAEASRSSILSTSDDRYTDYRKLMHGYLRSRDESGQPVWRYRVFDFSVAVTPGHLHTVIDVIRPDAQVRRFIYDGYICGDHLLLVGQPVIVGSEQHVVHVFPDALRVRGQSDTISGFCFVDSFDNSRLVTPTILSEKKLTRMEGPGPVPASDGPILDERWKTQLAQTRQLNFDPASFDGGNP